ncbi:MULTISPECIES: baseplate J/gp47 family protein [unclassified Vibrio]|uniref:baseplate J/gp47 family protein n=1 Tax=unclassified Vibrio TaxID=2614977 RepID=UPI000B8E6D8D|nr:MULTISPECIES: baseplate J/gp47 family protein [unclassified Vibrio]NAX44236.1 baseplate J protein [Vibrio sp. V25_P4S6T154]OXX41847.1 baseplate J protein [Vibrio sp. V17_P4S1T151]OXX60706.1 baseplate J protein [Vibrio sp. V15_P4S5T153]OXX63232.1 baseplate J protein [Vibrio sp. V20_P4S3T152]
MTTQYDRPKAFQEPDFETLLAEYVAFAVEHCAASDAEKAVYLQEALTNDSELLAQVLQALVLKYIADTREKNYWALQMFRKFVTESDMVDLMALQYNLKRQVLQLEDTSVFPPKPAVFESNDDLLRRFDLAPYQFHTTGTRLGYRFHALTLDERPVIKIESEADAVVVRYEFPKAAQPALVKDAQARMTEPNSGKVSVAILSRETANGIPSAALLERTSKYLNRDDIAQESDEITTKAATPIPYTISVVLYTGANPNNHVTKAQAQQTGMAFAERKHRLEEVIDVEEIGHEFYELGVKRVKVLEPAADVVCQWDEAPHCTEVIIDVRAE